MFNNSGTKAYKTAFTNSWPVIGDHTPLMCGSVQKFEQYASHFGECFEEHYVAATGTKTNNLGFTPSNL